MKFILSLLFLTPTFFIAQKITIKGHVRDLSKGRSKITISVNDTINKIFKTIDTDLLILNDLNESEKKL